jgi:hypothetical protein
VSGFKFAVMPLELILAVEGKQCTIYPQVSKRREVKTVINSWSSFAWRSTYKTACRQLVFVYTAMLFIRSHLLTLCCFGATLLTEFFLIDEQPYT